MDRSYKTISSADDRLNKTRLLGVILKDQPNPPNHGIDAIVDVEEDAFAPDPLRDPLPAHQLAGLLQQEEQKLHGNTRQSE